MRAFLCALTFLTRIPFPSGWQLNKDDFLKSTYFYPMIGLLIGALLTGLWLVCAGFLPNLVKGALLLCFYTIITGGIHFDGLVDTFDGLGSGAGRERILEIMKDTHVGAFGVVAIVLLLILKFSFYSSITRDLLPYLIMAPVFGRQAIVWALACFPYARKEGLGKSFNIFHDYVKIISTTLVTLTLSIFFFKFCGFLIFISAVAFSFFLMLYLSRIIGGLTGDTYGALCEITEVFIYLLGLLLGGIIL